MRHRRRSCSGYTLIELMVAVAVLGIIAVTGGRLLTKVFEFNLQSTARIGIQRDLRASMNIINRSLRQARADTVILTQAADGPPYSMITFTSVEGSTVTFRQSGRRLIQDITGANERTAILARNVEYIAFSYPQTDDNTIVSVSITLKKSTYLRRAAVLQMAITKIRLMN